MDSLTVGYGRANINEKCILCEGNLEVNQEMRTKISVEEKEIFLCDICRDIFLRNILNSKIEGLDS